MVELTTNQKSEFLKYFKTRGRFKTRERLVWGKQGGENRGTVLRLIIP